MTDLNGMKNHLDRTNSKAELRTSGRDFLGDLTDAVRDNPLPAALIGMGILWMFSGGGKTSIGEAMTSRAPVHAAGTVARGAGRMGKSILHGAESIGSTMADAAQGTMDAVSGAAGKLGRALTPSSDDDADPVHGYRAYEGEDWDEQSYPSRRNASSQSSLRSGLQQRISEAFEQRPLLIGAAGLALGAGVAASLPLTGTEKRTLGKVSDQLMNTVSDAMGQAKDMAAAAMDEAEAHGIGTQAARDALGSVSGKSNTPQ